MILMKGFLQISLNHFLREKNVSRPKGETSYEQQCHYPHFDQNNPMPGARLPYNAPEYRPYPVNLGTSANWLLFQN